MRLSQLLFTLLFLLISLQCSPALVFAEDAASPAGAADAEQADFLPQSAVSLGISLDNGVEAEAFLYRQVEEGVDIGIDNEAPYLVFVRFVSKESRLAVTKGLVAFKLENAEGQTAAVRMEPKDGYFVAGLHPGKKRFSRLLLGTKLDDDHKRQFSFKISSL